MSLLHRRHGVRLALVGVLLAGAGAPTAAQGPAPPPPPAGPEGDAPPPPVGPDGEEPAGPAPVEKWLDFTGFWEARGGLRTRRDPHQKDASVGETRLHLDWEKPWQKVAFKVAADFIYDPVFDHHAVRLDSGQGWVDLRQANVTFSPAEAVDVKIGRQILTWGTGDLIFVNDLFPKDWQAFFIGRDVEYLKAPSDALKISVFTDLADLDVVYTPCFDADRNIRGRRLSYYNATGGRIVGRNAVLDADVPDEWFDDDEWAARLSRTVGGYELAAYGYWGRWKSPGGIDPVSARAIFPRLNTYGGSVRGPLGRGIVNVEAAWYDSRQDRAGGDPFVNNSQLRLLVGYEQDMPEIARDLTVGTQYYVEWMADYDDYRRTLRRASPRADERRHVLTFRITKLLMNQNLTLSLFAYYSPSDADAYLRPKVAYKIDDNWSVEAGGNIFLEKYDHTFFGQFHTNTNLYAALRHAF